jgi:phosphoribosylformylglycinamidine (FGAM) synthase-like amidotransferase family enzyme
MYAQQLNGCEKLSKWISNTFKVKHKGKKLFMPPLPHVGICNGFKFVVTTSFEGSHTIVPFFTSKGFQGIVVGHGHDQMIPT